MLLYNNYNQHIQLLIAEIRGCTNFYVAVKAPAQAEEIGSCREVSLVHLAALFSALFQITLLALFTDLNPYYQRNFFEN